MAYYDRQLIQNLDKALEEGDMREQANRILAMLNRVQTFVDTINQAEVAIKSLGSKRSEVDRLKDKLKDKQRLNKDEESDDKQSEEEAQIKELNDEIDAIEKLHRQHRKAKTEITQLVTVSQQLYQTLNRLR